MPTYQYYCEKCEHQFEFFQSMKDQALTVCPQKLCAQTKWGKGKVKRLIGAGAGLIFKGSGFYITDYRSEKYKAAARKESAPSGSSTAPASKSSDTKSSGTGTSSTPAKPSTSSS